MFVVDGGFSEEWHEGEERQRERGREREKEREREREARGGGCCSLCVVDVFMVGTARCLFYANDSQRL